MKQSREPHSEVRVEAPLQSNPAPEITYGHDIPLLPHRRAVAQGLSPDGWIQLYWDDIQVPTAPWRARWPPSPQTLIHRQIQAVDRCRLASSLRSNGLRQRADAILPTSLDL